MDGSASPPPPCPHSDFSGHHSYVHAPTGAISVTVGVCLGLAGVILIAGVVVILHTIYKRQQRHAIAAERARVAAARRPPPVDEEAAVDPQKPVPLPVIVVLPDDGMVFAWEDAEGDTKLDGDEDSIKVSECGCQEALYGKCECARNSSASL